MEKLSKMPNISMPSMPNMPAMPTFGNSGSHGSLETLLKLSKEEGSKENILDGLFGDASEIIKSFNCGIESGVLFHGTMYITNRNIYFYSKLFNLEKKLRINLRHVKEIKKEGTVGFFTDAIYIITVTKNATKVYVFRSFWDRDKCFESLQHAIPKARRKSLSVSSQLQPDELMETTPSPTSTSTSTSNRNNNNTSNSNSNSLLARIDENASGVNNNSMIGQKSPKNNNKRRKNKSGKANFKFQTSTGTDISFSNTDSTRTLDGTSFTEAPSLQHEKNEQQQAQLLENANADIIAGAGDGEEVLPANRVDRSNSNDSFITAVDGDECEDDDKDDDNDGGDALGVAMDSAEPLKCLEDEEDDSPQHSTLPSPTKNKLHSSSNNQSINVNQSAIPVVVELKVPLDKGEEDYESEKDLTGRNSLTATQEGNDELLSLSIAQNLPALYNEELEHSKLTLSLINGTLPVTVEEYYQLFVKDNAPYSLAGYYAIDKNYDIKCTDWSAMNQSNNNLGQTREIKMVKPLYFPGYNSCRCCNIQKYTRYGDYGLIICSSTRMQDLPACTYFSVENTHAVRCIESVIDSTTGKKTPQVVVEITFEVKFVQYTMFRFLIESNTINEMTKWFKEFFAYLTKVCATHRAERAAIKAATKIGGTTSTATSSAAPSVSVSALASSADLVATAGAATAAAASVSSSAISNLSASSSETATATTTESASLTASTQKAASKTIGTSTTTRVKSQSVSSSINRSVRTESNSSFSSVPDESSSNTWAEVGSSRDNHTNMDISNDNSNYNNDDEEDDDVDTVIKLNVPTIEDSTLICTICSSLLTAPIYAIHPCQHVFCGGCLSEWYLTRSNPLCPTCGDFMGKFYSDHQTQIIEEKVTDYRKTHCDDFPILPTTTISTTTDATTATSGDDEKAIESIEYERTQKKKYEAAMQIKLNVSLPKPWLLDTKTKAKIAAKAATITTHNSSGTAVATLIPATANDESPLIYLSKNGLLESVDVLCYHFINVQDSEGKTALIHAMINDNFGVVLTLLKHGADAKIRDKEGKNALDYAKDDYMKELFVKNHNHHSSGSNTTI